MGLEFIAALSSRSAIELGFGLRNRWPLKFFRRLGVLLTCAGEGKVVRGFTTVLYFISEGWYYDAVDTYGECTVESMTRRQANPQFFVDGVEITTRSTQVGWITQITISKIVAAKIWSC